MIGRAKGGPAVFTWILADLPKPRAGITVMGRNKLSCAEITDQGRSIKKYSGSEKGEIGKEGEMYGRREAAGPLDRDPLLQ